MMDFMMIGVESECGQEAADHMGRNTPVISPKYFLAGGGLMSAGNALNLNFAKAVMDHGLFQNSRGPKVHSVKKPTKLNNIKTLLTAHTDFTCQFGRATSELKETGVLATENYDIV